MGPRLARGYGVAASGTHISACEPHPLAIGGRRRRGHGFELCSGVTLREEVRGARGALRVHPHAADVEKPPDEELGADRHLEAAARP